MPLTGFQQEVLALLARSSGAAGYLAGGTALHSAPTSYRFSDDLDLIGAQEDPPPPPLHCSSEFWGPVCGQWCDNTGFFCWTLYEDVEFVNCPDCPNWV